ncbi:MAG: choice-of-anchor J domain-containing protein [Bacteroidota bacterium]|nr:choice-of-anchor J domain-containing protein [Bacteroidota bacterium]
MKKISPFIFIPFFLLSFQLGSAQQLNESFEGNTFPPPGWTTSNVLGAAVWQSSITEAHSGAKSAFINYENNAQGEDWLKTPQIFSIKSGDYISFWLKNPYTKPYPPDNMEVLISTTTNQNSSFTTTLANIDVTTLLGGNWVQFSYPLSSFAGQNIYIAFKHTDNNGSGVFLDDVTAGSPLTNDAASKGITVTPSAIVTPGTSLTVVDTILNAGSNALAAGIPVKYNVNNGPALTAGSTSASIAPGAFTPVSFSYTAPSAGIYTIKVFSALAADIHAGNDTITYTLNVQLPITAFPVFEDFTNPVQWTYSGNAAVWDITTATNPAGSNNDNVARARFYITNAGKVFYLQSPLLNFSGIAKPMIDFYVAYRTYQGKDDKLEVVVSLDGGVSFQPTPLYGKSYTTGLSTLGYDPLLAEFFPSAAGDWRHEAVDLSAYSNQPNVMIAFKATSALGNDLYIDDVNILDQNPSLYSTTTITTPGQVATGPFNTKVKFNTIGKAAGGIVKFQGSTNPPPSGGFATNTTATSADGTISSPNFVFPQYQTITYTGNDSIRANYDISLDITGITGIQNADKLYIVKRSDQTGLWVSYPTTRLGNILTATGFNNFSDFGIAYYTSTLPLNLISFNGKVNNGKANLSWQTNNEKNILGYDIERLINNTWTKIGYVPSAGNRATANSYSFDDNTPVNGINYYRLQITDADGKFSYSRIINLEIEGGKFVVYQNVPNPFTNSTTIRYDVAEKSSVKIVVYNVDGSQVKVLTNETKDAGSYEVKWNTSNISSGNYFYKVMIGNKVITKKMLKL